MRKTLSFIIGAVVMALYIGVVVLGNDPLQPSIASKILRFHVLANSDSSRDQELKLLVRDAVGTYLQPYLENAESLEETKQIINAHMDDILKVAKETLEEHGSSYAVKAKIKRVDFPVKSYGSYTFPKGEYEALQIEIGEAKGQNWWCVLYPNMCFKGTVYEVVEKDAQTALKEVLSPLEYADVFEDGQIELRFKFLEYFAEKR